MYLDKDAILSSLHREDIIKILEDLGSPTYRNGDNGELIFKTVCHGGNSFKLYYYHEATDTYPPKIFHCYSGCQDSFSIFELVIRVNRLKGNNITFFQALNYIGSFTGNMVYSQPLMIDDATQITDWKWIDRLKNANKPTKEIPKCKVYKENLLDLFCYLPHESWLEDGITRSAMSEFEISYYSLTNQIIIPHRDINGNLIGIRGRYMFKSDVELYGKYMPLLIEGQFITHALGNNLYGIWQNKNKIQAVKKVIIYESEKSVLLNKGYFGINDFSVAVCGSSISKVHIKLLLEVLKVEEVIVAFDRDYEASDSLTALLYRNKILKQLAPFVPYCRTYVLWDDLNLLKYKQSPADAGKEILLQLLDNKIAVTTEDLAKLNSEILC